MRSGILFVLVGPTAGGKTTLAKRLVESNPQSLRLSVSATSRKPRPDEIDNISYYFLNRSDFETRIKSGEFFEWEEVHGNLYGTLRSAVESSLKAGTDLLLDIDIRGALTFKEHFGTQAIVIFLVPPSPEILRTRLESRGKLPDLEIAKRFKTAEEEYTALLFQASQGDASKVDYFVLNDQIELTYQQLSAIICAERLKLHRLGFEEIKSVCRIA